MGYQDDLYALPGLPGELQHWLEVVFLKQADQEADDALQYLLADQLDLPPKLKSGWSRFIMTLFSRTPERIAELRATYEAEVANRMDTLSRLYDEDHANDEKSPSPEQKAADILRGNELATGQLLQRVMDLPGVGHHLNNMPWAVFNIPNGDRSLLTSDRPAHLSGGLQNNDSHIILPISPTKLFVAANDRSLFRSVERMSPSDSTQQVNLLVASNAKRYVYATDDFQRNFIDRYFRPAQ
jgi:hypothetical protein